MDRKTRAIARVEPASGAVDWAVFWLGLLSLTVAIVATILMKTAIFSADARDGRPNVEQSAG